MSGEELDSIESEKTTNCLGHTNTTEALFIFLMHKKNDIKTVTMFMDLRPCPNIKEKLGYF
jgi:hypothetical protein